MLIPERQTKLRQIIASRGMSDLETLAAELGVSTSTVRRDIEAMEQEGVVKRTHGGVIWTGERGETGLRPYAFDQRMNYQLEAKQRIARAARKLVQPGQTVLIDGGTTTFHLARELVGEPLQLLTNSLPIANLFLNDDNVELILTGGLVYPRYGVLLGPMTEHILQTVHAQLMFFSVAGVRDGSLYNQNLLLVQAEREMMRQAQQVILLVDSSKFGQQALARLCGLREVDTVVTDAGIPEDHAKAIRDSDCELIIATDED